MTASVHHDNPTPTSVAGHRQKRRAKSRTAHPATERNPGCPDGLDDAHLLQQMLQMADRYVREGHRRQALDLLWRVLRHPSCGPHGKAARRAVAAIARTYESEGARHTALDLLEKLLDV